MCPVLATLPFLVIFLCCYGINKLFRRRKLSSNGKSVFITGCDRGFGETLSTQLALEGYTVYSGCLDIHSPGATQLRTNPRIHVLPLDVTSDTDVTSAVQHVEREVGEQGLWAVVNNAGVAVFAQAEWCTMAAYERVIGVNLMGTIRVSKEFAPLIRRGRGRIINISSLAGRCALPGFTAYSASKNGIIGFSDSLRRELATFGVKVITIEPKLYRTAIADADFHVRNNEQMWSETRDTVKLDYGDTYFRAFLDKMLENLKMSSRRTYQVMDDLIHATTSAHPYTRYVPGLKMAIMSDLFIVQPNIVQDYCVDKKLSVPCTPFMLRTKRSV